MNENLVDQTSEGKNSNKDNLKDIFLAPHYGIKGEPPGDNINHKSFMGRSSFSTRYWLFLISGIIAICGMTALLFQGDQLLSNSVNQVREASYLTKLIFRIESEIVALNSDSRNFIGTKDLRYVENYNKRAKTLVRDLKLLINNPVSPTSQKLATTVFDGVAEHNKQFSKIVKIQALLGFNKKIGILANVQTSLDILEKGLYRINPAIRQSKLHELLSQIKMRESVLPYEFSQKNKQNIYRLMSLIDKSLGSPKIPSELSKSLKSLVKSHLKDLTQLASTYSTYNKAKTRLGEISNYIAPSIDNLINFNDNLSLLTRQESQRAQDLIRQVMLFGSIGIFIFLIIVNILIIRSIIKPSKKIAEASMELAHGNVSAPIPYLANKDEIGRLSNALMIFRENMLQADRLRKELEIARQKHPQPSTENIPNAHNFLSEDEHRETEVKEEPVNFEIPIGGDAISKISAQLTTTSQNASNAFEEVERTEVMVSGLNDTAEKIEDIEILMIGIGDQVSLLAVQTALQLKGGSNEENLIHLQDRLNKEKSGIKLEAGKSIDDRVKTIQNETKQVINEVQKIGVNIHNLSEVARDIANTISREALEAANELLRRSEDLRSMLDNILDKTQNEKLTKTRSKIQK